MPDSLFRFDSLQQGTRKFQLDTFWIFAPIGVSLLIIALFGSSALLGLHNNAETDLFTDHFYAACIPVRWGTENISISRGWNCSCSVPGCCDTKYESTIEAIAYPWTVDTSTGMRVADTLSGSSLNVS